MALTDEDRAEIADIFAAQVSGDAFKAAIGAALEGHKTTVDPKLVERLDALATTVDGLTKGGAGGAGGGKGAGAGAGAGQGDDDVHKLVEAATADIRKKFEDEREAREKAEQRARVSALNSQATNALAKAGYSGVHQELALNALRGSDVFSFDDDGNPLMKGLDDYKRETLLSLDKGIAQWAKTDKGRALMPASPQRGVGIHNNGGGGGQHPGGGKKITSVAALREAL